MQPWTRKQSLTDVGVLHAYLCIFHFHRVEEKRGWLAANPGYVSWKHEDDKVIVFERADTVFVFNFNSSKSFADYKVIAAK